MAFRLKPALIIIILIGCIIISYSSFMKGPVMRYHVETKTEENESSQLQDVDNSSVIVNETKEELSAKPAEKPVKPSLLSLIQSIPLKAVENQTDKTSQGILTESLYEAGYDIPNVDLCPEFGEGLKVLVGVMSAPSHEDARRAIRYTWGHYALQKNIVLGFIVGNSKIASLNAITAEESTLYGDIIRGNFIDSYDNLTLKTISFLSWIDNYCSKAHFILKTDDDMFINFPKLLSFIDKHWKTEKTIHGRLAKKWKPIRNKRSKYCVSTKQFSQAVFPDFTTGPAYLLTGDIVRDMYTKALKSTYLKLEDVFTTGIVAQALNIKRVHVNEFINKRIPFNICNIKKSISIHMIKYHEQFDLWKKLSDGRSKCK
ncbi:beta-1,3-galactosyltransferase 5-like isoform X2 [Cimex lectularius]|nr:beta-1,3-galactosyltransferase 5-like isoform X2 [Cimex lectularius]XP_014256310.1 beta-1,3-galactosyltransferase 5-like isoform X2 [Cimex lectularius]XP_014256312.1 beta-1,3-galactosyltransferase 5-like isoform X2 [Cimex lectularius]XP_014256314.1 beta-1,3-galactosyltransferase 5-like isoform X2 [Cimex lectularius]XP_014256315.1 beta-1,3-galactosyltransferase 5-like isoform X2 [Cimex lectularius]XP_014256316.1 beta-1,3-galactosyltransferase 5-like isoform X2 [Cimex lectularius]XP_01425631